MHRRYSIKNGHLLLVVLLAHSLFPCVVCTAAPSLSLAGVLMRYTQAQGQNTNRTYVASGKGARITATYASGGLTGSLVWIETPQDKEWSQSTLGGVTDTSGFDGKVAWRQDVNDNVRLLSTEELKSRRTNAEDTLRSGVAAKMHIVKTHQFTIGDVSLSQVPTDLSEDEKAGTSHLLAGIIGAQILSRFVVTFDYPHHRMFLAPQAHTQDIQDIYDTRTFGILLFSFTDISGSLRVGILQIDKDVAKRTKLAAGDEVTEIDGKPGGILGREEVARLMSPAGGVDSHTLITRREHSKAQTAQVVFV